MLVLFLLFPMFIKFSCAPPYMFIFSFVTIIQFPIDGDEPHSPICEVPLNVSRNNVGDGAADAYKVCCMCLHYFLCSFPYCFL